jgi:hypothetical protein
MTKLNAAIAYHSMRIALTALVTACVIGLPATGASAGPLDGHYVSNKSNQMRISGSRYTYIPRQGTTNPKNVRSSGSVRPAGGNVYKFSGYLSYSCTLFGTTLNCGRRIWYRQ